MPMKVYIALKKNVNNEKTSLMKDIKKLNILTLFWSSHSLLINQLFLKKKKLHPGISLKCIGVWEQLKICIDEAHEESLLADQT